MNEWLLQVYIIDCAVVREKINTYDTIRNKLRAIDHVAQCVGIKQEHLTSPALDVIIKCCNKRNKGRGSNTIPITIEKRKAITEHILRKKIAMERLDAWDEKSIKTQWRIYNLNVLNNVCNNNNGHYFGIKRR